MKNKTPFTKKEYLRFMTLMIGLPVILGFFLLAIGDIFHIDVVKFGGILLVCSMLIPMRLYFVRWYGYEINQLRLKLDRKTKFESVPMTLTMTSIRDRLTKQDYLPVAELTSEGVTAFVKKNTYVVLDASDKTGERAASTHDFFRINRSETRGITLYYVCHGLIEDETRNALLEFHKESLVHNKAQIQFRHLGEDARQPEKSVFHPLILQNHTIQTVSRRIGIRFQSRILKEPIARS